jgi:hypothetical protein
MLASDGIPEGGISQPLSGRRLKIAKTAAIARERMSLTPDRMAFPLSRDGARPSGALGRFNEFAGDVRAN